MEETAKEHIRIASREIAGGVYELAIAGSLDWTNFAEVEAAFTAIFDKGIYKIVVNLKDIKYIASAGFGCFISSFEIATKNRGDIFFVATPPEVMDVFNILGLKSILRFADSVSDAVALLK